MRYSIRAAQRRNREAKKEISCPSCQSLDLKKTTSNKDFVYYQCKDCEEKFKCPK
jgi:transposase-like protein